MAPIRSWWAGLDRWDRRFVAAGIGLPLAFFLIPAFFGHPFVSGDNTGQNFPLRVLVGRDLRHGHLPLWDPYIWSGTPLLGGFNAGAFFPPTLLFVFLPPSIAWSIGEALVVIVASSGLYTFLRLHRLSPLAAGVGAASWCGLGFLGAQVVHIASVQGWGLVPWVLVALQRIVTGPPERRPRWAALLGLSFGCVILAGDPESMVQGSMLAGIYLLAILWQARRLRPLAWVVIGSAAGLALGGLQWVPGLSIAGGSQRGMATFSFFTAGSVSPANVPLLFSPFLTGGFGRFGVPYFLGNYSLAELSGYAGFVGIAAAFSMVFLWRRDPAAREWRVWYLIGAIGVMLAMGENTPLAHLMFHFPLYRLLRLPSRNLAWMDLAASVLAAFWVDRVLRAPRRRLAKVASLAPVAIVTGVLVALVVDGHSVVATLATTSQAVAGSHTRALVMTVAVQLLIGMGFVYVVLRSLWVRGIGRESGAPARRRHRRTALLLLAVLASDVAYYELNQDWFLAPSLSSVTGANPMTDRLAQALAAVGGGRFAIYDPNRYNVTQLVHLSEPDINIHRGLPSIQGYGSVEPAGYSDLLDAHQQLNILPQTLGDGTTESLGLTVLLVPDQYLVSVVSQPSLNAAQQGYRLAHPAAPPPASSSPVTPASGPVEPGSSAAWFWGEPDAPVSIDVTARPRGAAPEGEAGFQVGTVGYRGATRWFPESRLHPDGEGGWVLTPAPGARLTGVGVAVRPVGDRPLDVSSVRFSDLFGFTYALEGTLTQALSPSRWEYVGITHSYSIYVDRAAVGADHLSGPTDGSVVADPISPWGVQTVEVTALRPTVLLRSESYAPGWKAVLLPQGACRVRSCASDAPPGGSVSQAVERHGLVQSVTIPSAGRWRVVFSYQPPRIVVAVATSIGGLGTLVLLTTTGRWLGRLAVRRRRRLHIGL